MNLFTATEGEGAIPLGKREKLEGLHYFDLTFELTSSTALNQWLGTGDGISTGGLQAVCRAAAVLWLPVDVSRGSTCKGAKGKETKGKKTLRVHIAKAAHNAQVLQHS